MTNSSVTKIISKLELLDIGLHWSPERSMYLSRHYDNETEQKKASDLIDNLRYTDNLDY
jgi:hypothetical protein